MLQKCAGSSRSVPKCPVRAGPFLARYPVARCPVDPDVSAACLVVVIVVVLLLLLRHGDLSRLGLDGFLLPLLSLLLTFLMFHSLLSLFLMFLLMFLLALLLLPPLPLPLPLPLSRLPPGEHASVHRVCEFAPRRVAKVGHLGPAPRRQRPALVDGEL